MAAVMPVANAPGERVIRAEFTGSAGEYFRIWIVNLFFTLITLGIYSAWAKVRKRRYFYGSTRLDGATFDYFASPKAVLKGRIIAVIVVLAYAFLGEVFPMARFVFWGIALVMLPWLAVRAYQFNARNSGWRGLRFGFDGTTGQAARTWAAMIGLTLVTFGFALPWAVARMKRFVLSHHLFGRTAISCEMKGGPLFAIYLLAGLIVTAIAVPFMIASVLLIAFADVPEEYQWALGLMLLVPVYAGYIVGYAYSEAKSANLLWNNTYGPGMRFASDLSAAKLTQLYLGNIVAVALTAGLLIPWAVIRTLRYRLESFSIVLEGEPVHEANPALPRVGAAGQEIGDMFNLDLGV
jgi:uncharacterized membrane protein YjgN (DUF898 family)